MTDADILNKAADLLAQPGAWTQGGYGDGMPTCMGGAINMAAGYRYHECGQRVVPLSLWLKDLLGTSVSEWNDAEGRTQAEVVAKLREAASVLSERNRRDVG